MKRKDKHLKEYDDTLKHMAPSPSTGTSRVVTVPWWWEEIGFKALGKIIWKGILFVLALYLLHFFFGWWFLLGLVPIPFWIGYLWYILDRENILLLEYRIKGEQIKDQDDKIVKTVNNSHIKMYKVPPDIWKKLEKVGDVFQIGDKFYICDYYNPSGKKVYFSVHKSFSNINFRKEHLWVRLKDLVPTLEKKLVWYVEAYRMASMDKALELYGQTRRQEEFFLTRDRGTIKLKMKEKEEVPDGQ